MDRTGEGTWFAIDRKLFTSSLWFDSPWKLKIFIYLLGNANHEAGSFMGVPIGRGELIRSYRTIAKECGYKVGYRLKKPSYDTIRRVCEDLTKESRIEQRTVQCGTLFKILNYDKLQPQKKHEPFNEPVSEPFNDRSMTVQNKNIKNVKIKDFPPICFEISNRLLEQIICRDPGFKKPNIDQWARHVDLLTRVDGRTPEQINAILSWLQCDQFWQAKILSTANLRQKFGRLVQEMQRNGGRSSPNTSVCAAHKPFDAKEALSND